MNDPRTDRRCRVWVRWARLVCVVAGLLGVVAPVHAEQREAAPDRVVRLTLPLDGGQVTGVIARYDNLLFTLRDEQGTSHRVLWSAIPAPNVDRYWRFLEQPAGDAEALFELGDLLARHRDGAALARRAFDEALALDPALADAVERSLQGRSPDNSPRYVGDADPQMWGELSADLMARSTDALKATCERIQRELAMEMSLYESERFLVLTDCDAEQVLSLATKLTEGYRAAAELLGDDPDGNVFRGKCLVVLFRKRADYMRFQRDLHDTDARGTGGLCHGFGDGFVHVAAFQRPSARQTNHILVHELVHAYVHRYRSPVPIDDWLNEGLATHLAHRVEPPPGDGNLYLKARLALEGRQGLGEGFYEGENLAAWQYDVAAALTAYLLERSERAYPRLIQQIKDGTPTAEALETVYRMEPRVLTRRFKQRLDRELNRQLGG